MESLIFFWETSNKGSNKLIFQPLYHSEKQDQERPSITFVGMLSIGFSICFEEANKGELGGGEES